jgi:very-short-patch-repair endonuclease
LLKAKGFHFRRQVPIEGFVADFACYRARLIIELDGGQHNEERGIAHDRMRDKTLQHYGYAVLRFWNHDVLTNTDAMMDQIRLALPLASDLASMKDNPHP